MTLLIRMIPFQQGDLENFSGTFFGTVGSVDAGKMLGQRWTGR